MKKERFVEDDKTLFFIVEKHNKVSRRRAIRKTRTFSSLVFRDVLILLEPLCENLLPYKHLGPVVSACNISDTDFFI